jgi:hypothetical protein
MFAVLTQLVEYFIRLGVTWLREFNPARGTAAR